MPTALRQRFSASEFFAWEAEQLDRHEFVRGQVFSMAGGTPEHALLAARIIGQLSNALAGTPCEAYSSDLAVEVEAGAHYCYPDVTVVCGPVERSASGPAVTNPAVVVEVLSPSTASWDRGGKLDGYRGIPSVQAVVFVSTDHPHADAVVRDGERWYVQTADEEGRLALNALGASLDVRTLFEGVEFADEPWFLG